jgi:hypothetical protein
LFIPGLAGGAKFVNLIIEDPNAKEPWSPGGAPPSSPVVTNLGKARILASELSPLNPSLSPFSFDGNELYYGKSKRKKGGVCMMIQYASFLNFLEIGFEIFLILFLFLKNILISK